MSSLFDLLAKMEAEKWSGELGVSSSQGNATILIREGQFLWAHRPLDRAIEKISKFSWVQLPPDAVLRHSKSWEDLVRILLHANPDNYNRLVRFLKTDRLELFFRIFFWSNMELSPRAFAVQPPDPVELGFYSTRKISTLLKEAKRRIEEWPQIQTAVGSSKRLFICQVDLPPQNPAARDVIDEAFLEKEDTLSSGLPYTFEEIEILRSCDGTKTVQDLVRDSTDGEFLTLRRLMNLWEKGAVVAKDEENFLSHSRIKSKGIPFKETFAALIVCIALSAAFLLIHSLKTELGSHAQNTVPLQQALEIFKLQNDRYPLTLTELETVLRLPQSYKDSFRYELTHPLEYKLMIK